jgi:hypothetical protein
MPQVFSWNKLQPLESFIGDKKDVGHYARVLQMADDRPDDWFAISSMNNLLLNCRKPRSHGGRRLINEQFCRLAEDDVVARFHKLRDFFL